MIIKNGNIALHGSKHLISLDIKTEQGKIISMGENLHGTEVLDAGGLQIFPGAIDPHVHFNEPGFTEREDFYHGSCEAVSGGVTTVIDMPCTSLPPVISLKNMNKKLDVVSKRSVADFGFFGGVSAQLYHSGYRKAMQELSEYVLGFKSYFLSGMDSFRELSISQFRDVLKEAERLDCVVLLHAEDPERVGRWTWIQKTKGNGWKHYYRSRPEEAETVAVKNALKAAAETGAKLHIVHIGTAEAAALLKNAENVSGETAPHYLQFSADDLEQTGGALKTAPVVKGKANKKLLWEYLINGTLDFIASDHAPAPAEQKNTGSAWKDYAGIPGTGTIFPYIYSEGFVKREIPLPRFLEITTENAARRYGIFDRKGSIEIGKDADLVFVDPKGSRKIRGKEFYSKGKITPFENMIFQGKVQKTMIRGKVVYDSSAGINAEPGYGQFLKPGTKAEKKR
ncbi:MAG: amidohydrolase family protein [Fidelibacterota bacterium]